MRVLPRPSAELARSRPGRQTWWLVASIFVILGASAPEVVKVRVPSEKVSNWFPPGSDLHVLPYDRFEALVKAARERPSPPRAPRLLKARHSARWESGRLLGRTELTIEAAPDLGAGLLLLEPWSPALLDRGQAAKLLRATPDGRLGLKVDPLGPPKAEFEWTLKARPGSDGRAFALDLPAVDVSALALDLPSGMVPEYSSGPRTGPESGPAPGRSTWSFETARGRVDLRIGVPAEPSKLANLPGLWLEGTTRIDLGASPINWRADWTLDELPGAPRTLTIGLDPGLEVVDVVGPRVASFRLEPDGSGSRVALKLNGEGAGPSPLTIRAICQVPTEGSWSIPSARPLDATWIGGRTLVRLDAGRVFQSCQERSGRRVSPRSGDPAGPGELIFEPRGGPGPLAELTFRKPMADATVEVRGLLRLGDDTPRIDVALTWAVEKGRLLSFAADLPPGWTPDGVVSAARLPVPWHADPLGSGGTRVHLAPALADEASHPVTLILSASARQAGVTGPLDLPRVRPAQGVRVVDEVWVATSDPTLGVRPILGSGLAWLDPPVAALDDGTTPWAAENIERALAWRWVVEDAEARIDRTPSRASPRGEVKLVATIRSRRLALDWTIDFESPLGDLDLVPIHVDKPLGGPIHWKTREAGGPIIESRPMDDARRASLGLPTTGQAWDLVLSGPSKRKVQLLGRVEGPWPGRGRLPILTLPERFNARGIAEVVVENSTRVKVDSAGFTPIVPSSPLAESAASTEDPVATSESSLRTAGVYGYGSSGGHLLVETTDPQTDPGQGLIREAYLVSHVSPGAGMRHRLTLGIATDSARSVSLVMPEGVAIDRLRRDGLAVAPIPTDGKLLVEVPPPGPGRPLCTLTLDYRTSDDPRAGPIEPHRLLPEFSLPCLGFAWELIAPEPWVLEKTARGLKATDPRAVSSLASRLLGFHWSPWGDREPAPSAQADEGLLRELDKAASDIADGETNLGDWFLKLDAGRPLVLDRLAIRSIGWGPGTRIGADSGESKPPSHVRSILEPMGLVAMPLGGLILITAEGEVPDRPSDREAWAEAIRTVPSEDSDGTDRFQAAARWQGETTPRALASGESPGFPSRVEGWHAWRVVSNGWPPAGASVALVDERSDRAWGWFVAAMVLTAGVFSKSFPGKARAIGLGLIGVVATLGLAWQWPEGSTTCTGLLRGGLGVLAFWLGRSFRPIPRSTPTPTSQSEVSTTSHRGGFLAGSSIATALAIASGLGVASSGSQLEAPILALLPFDGPANPASKPDRVVLLVKDHERLELLARRDDPPVVAAVSLVSASHKVGRDAPGQAVVESSYEIEVSGAGPASWTLPVGQALELHAEVDDRPSPLAISPDGLSATLNLEGAGIHRVRFRRLAPVSAIGRGGERVRVPINRAAFARVAVSRGVGPSWVEVVGALGDVSVDAEGIAGGLGPLDALEVHWFPESRPPAPGFQGPVEATFLWDARPVGDLIRMRLLHSDPDGVSAVRVALEPGLVVRRYSIPNVVSIKLEGTEARPEWVAHVDPPLRKDVPIEVDFWRAAGSGSGERRWPEIDVPTLGKITGLIGFRRPSDWSGRLEPAAGSGVEVASEASFARAWGMLPDDGLTLAGAVRLVRSGALAVETKPVPLRRSIRTKVVAGPSPGRLNVAIEGVLTDRQGRSFDLEVAIPNDLRLVRVEADGLLDWRKVARDRLRLQFDGSEVPERKVRIEGFVPAPADSVMSETRSHQAKVPWPRWADAESTPGTIEIAGPTRFQFEAGEGTAATPVALPADADGVARSSYRVDRPLGVSTVSWSAPPAKVNVAVDTELAIDPTSLTWTAVLSCEVSGGPASTLNLNLPTDWAEGASLEIEGNKHRLVSRASGPKGEITHWTIYPESPIWGSARLILRSTRPLRPGREFVYPQVAPLATAGRGSVGRFDLAIRNGSGRSMEIAGSSGLQPVDVSRLHAVESFSTHRSWRSIDHAYHVTGERWSLRLRIGRSGDEASKGREASVAFAQLTCSLDENGATWGRARYELEPRSGPFLAIRLSERSEVPWASVDGAIVSAFLDEPGRWLIPLGDRQPRRVTFAWHRPGASAQAPGRESIALPMPDHPPPATLISVDRPDDVDFAMLGDAVEGVSLAGWEVENVEQLSRRVIEAMGNLDRSSRRDREAILDDLTEIELRGRHVSRVPVSKDASADPTFARLQSALNLIVEASQAAGLDDLIQEARVRVGIAQADDDSARGLATPSPEIVRLRRSGDSRFFKASGGESRRLPTIARSKKVSNPRLGSAGSWAVAGTGLLFWMVVGGLIARGSRPTSRLAASLVLLAILAWEPVGLLAALGLLAWGRLSG